MQQSEMRVCTCPGLNPRTEPGGEGILNLSTLGRGQEAKGQAVQSGEKVGTGQAEFTRGTVRTHRATKYKRSDLATSALLIAGVFRVALILQHEVQKFARLRLAGHKGNTCRQRKRMHNRTSLPLVPAGMVYVSPLKVPNPCWSTVKPSWLVVKTGVTQRRAKQRRLDFEDASVWEANAWDSKHVCCWGRWGPHLSSYMCSSHGQRATDTKSRYIVSM